MEQKILFDELVVFRSRIKEIFDKDPFRSVHPENISLYNTYVKKMKELFPDQEELQELKEIDPKERDFFNDELYLLVGRLNCFTKLLKRD